MLRSRKFWKGRSQESEMLETRSRKFWKAGYFTSDSVTLLLIVLGGE